MQQSLAQNPQWDVQKPAALTQTRTCNTHTHTLIHSTDDVLASLARSLLERCW